MRWRSLGWLATVGVCAQVQALLNGIDLTKPGKSKERRRFAPSRGTGRLLLPSAAPPLRQRKKPAEDKAGGTSMNRAGEAQAGPSHAAKAKAKGTSKGKARRGASRDGGRSEDARESEADDEKEEERHNAHAQGGSPFADAAQGCYALAASAAGYTGFTRTAWRQVADRFGLGMNWQARTTSAPTHQTRAPASPFPHGEGAHEVLETPVSLQPRSSSYSARTRALFQDSDSDTIADDAKRATKRARVAKLSAVLDQARADYAAESDGSSNDIVADAEGVCCARCSVLAVPCFWFSAACALRLLPWMRFRIPGAQCPVPCATPRVWSC